MVKAVQSTAILGYVLANRGLSKQLTVEIFNVAPTTYTRYLTPEAVKSTLNNWLAEANPLTDYSISLA